MQRPIRLTSPLGNQSPVMPKLYQDFPASPTTPSTEAPMHELWGWAQEALKQHLAEDETVLFQCVGRYHQAVIGTTQKVIVLKSGIFAYAPFSGRISVFTHSKANLVAVKTSLLGGVFEVTAGTRFETELLSGERIAESPFTVPGAVPFIALPAAIRDFTRCAAIIRGLVQTSIASKL